MTIEEMLKDLIVSRYGSAVAFTRQIGMANSTLATIFARGIHNASIESIIRICSALGISADALAQDRIVPIPSAERVTPDVLQMLTSLSYTIETEEITANGDPVSDAEKQSILDTLEVLKELIARRHR